MVYYKGDTTFRFFVVNIDETSYTKTNEGSLAELVAEVKGTAYSRMWSSHLVWISTTTW